MAIGCGLALVAGYPAGAAEIMLRGTVPVICTVEVTDRDVTLDLAGATTDVPVATIDESCNAPAGYTVTLESRNQGRLVHTGTADTAVGYRLAYDGSVTGTGALTVSRTAPGSLSRNLAVTTDAPGGGRVAGSYLDIITVTLEAK